MPKTALALLFALLVGCSVVAKSPRETKAVSQCPSSLLTRFDQWLSYHTASFHCVERAPCSSCCKSEVHTAVSDASYGSEFDSFVDNSKAKANSYAHRVREEIKDYDGAQKKNFDTICHFEHPLSALKDEIEPDFHQDLPERDKNDEFTDMSWCHDITPHRLGSRTDRSQIFMFDHNRS